MGLIKIGSEMVRDFGERFFKILSDQEKEYLFYKLCDWKREQTAVAAKEIVLTDEEKAFASPKDGGSFSWADLARKIMLRANVPAAVAREAIDQFISSKVSK